MSIKAPDITTTPARLGLNLDKSTWTRVRFGDVAQASKEKVDPILGEIERYVAGEHMDSNDLKIHRWGGVGEGYLGPAFHRRFRPGQVLYGSRRTYLRKVAVAEFEGVCANTTFVVESKDTDVLLQEFLPFVMSSESFHGFAIQESKGSVNPYVNWSDIARYEFSLPPLDEQKRLADLLWSLERHRRALTPFPRVLVEDQLLDKLLRVEAPKRPVAEMGSVLMGRQRSPKHAHGDHLVPYLRVANVGENELRLSDVKSMNFTPDEQERYAIRPGDILLSEGQSRELVGQSVLVKDGDLGGTTCFQNTLIRFRADENRVSPEYAQNLFRACLRAEVFSDIASQTTSIAHLGVQRFAALELPWPSLAKQAELLEPLNQLHKANAACRDELDGLESLRVALLAEIFEEAA